MSTAPDNPWLGLAEVQNLLDLHPRDWPTYFKRHLDAPAFQGRNAARWVFRRGATSWLEMTDMPASLRESLQSNLPLLTSKLELVSEANDGACKILLSFPDGATVEAVGMPGTRGRTICLSTQVGCAVKCGFCASGLDGLQRNLRPSEILQQAIWLKKEQGDFHRVVVMGMGEPGHNLDAVLQSLECLLDPEGADMAARRITLSTVAPSGTLPKLAAWGRQVKVALSLHSPDDATRQKLLPGVCKSSISETLQEADALFEVTGREYTVEYVLMRGENDRPEDAEELAILLRDRRCHVNLIPYNPVPELPFERPPDESLNRFAQILRQTGLPVTMRVSLGGSKDAACGQLRRQSTPPQPGPTPA